MKVRLIWVAGYYYVRQQVLEEQPLERSTMLQIYGIWFRNTTAPNNTTPDDDTIP